MASKRRIRTASLLVVAVGSMILAGTAHGASGAKTTSTIAFTDNESLLPVAIPVVSPDDPDTFDGTVSSSTKCKAGRTVKVFKKGAEGAKDTVVGKGTSAADGKWTVAQEDPGTGRYYAWVNAKSGCAAGRSKGIDVTDA
jgi:hypothetical protein